LLGSQPGEGFDQPGEVDGAAFGANVHRWYRFLREKRRSFESLAAQSIFMRARGRPCHVAGRLRWPSWPPLRSGKTFASPSGLRSVFHAVDHDSGDAEPYTKSP
jgi:hypothetical protein